jgi:RNA polymerase sigma factor (sigma-70 family)
MNTSLIPDTPRQRVRCCEDGTVWASLSSLAKDLNVPVGSVSTQITQGMKIRGKTYERIDPGIGRRSSVAVICITTGRHFKSSGEAAREMNIRRGDVVRACQMFYKIGGHQYRYADDQLHQKAIDRKASMSVPWERRPNVRTAPFIVRPDAEIIDVLTRLSPWLAMMARVYARRYSFLAGEDEWLSHATFGVIDALSRPIAGCIDAYCKQYARHALRRGISEDRNAERAYRRGVTFNVRTFTRIEGRSPSDANFAGTIADTTEAGGAGFRFADLIETLNPTERQIIRLFYIADASLPEIANFLGLPLDEVERVYARAMNELRSIHAAG